MYPGSALPAVIKIVSVCQNGSREPDTITIPKKEDATRLWKVDEHVTIA